VVVNPLREPGLDAYWVPSIPKSAVFGTRLADEFYQVRNDGDIAFCNAVLKILIERGALDTRFIAEHTTGFEELKQQLAAQRWEDLEASSGLSRVRLEQFAETYMRARTAVFIWSMGLTQHSFGVENVLAVINLALARGMVGREVRRLSHPRPQRCAGRCRGGFGSHFTARRLSHQGGACPSFRAALGI
jgi:anaerobic selenocysteine-containing dehydrogenase